MQYSTELRRLQEKIALKKQLEAKLKELHAQREEFREKAEALRMEAANENADVLKLEGKSLAKYFYLVIGKLDDKLTEEREQAAAAKVKLDAAEAELAAIDSDILDIEEQLEQLKDCENVYNTLFYRRRKEVRESGTPAGEEILKLEEQIAYLESQKREIREARSAGKDALRAARDVMSELQSAANWNTWDILGGDGLITHAVKHQHLDTAQADVMALQGVLRRFKTELADINIQANMQVNVEGFLRFADFFFDGLFADWTVGEKIKDSQYSVAEVRRKIEKALDKLTDLDKAADQKIKELKAQIEALVVGA